MRLAAAALCLLAVGLSYQQTPAFRVNDVTVMAGKKVTLVPEVNGRWTEISWKKGDRVVAEWHADPWYADTLRGRAELNGTSGALTFAKPQQNDSGDYSAEVVVDSKYQSTFFRLHVLKPPEPPWVNCTGTPAGFWVRCYVAENMNPTYRWEYQKSQKAIPGNTSDIRIKEAVDPLENITCVISIHGAEASGSISLSDCTQEGAAPPENKRNRVILCLLFGGVFGAGLAYWCWNKGLFKCKRKDRSQECEDVGGGAEKQRLHEERPGNSEENRGEDGGAEAETPLEKQRLHEEHPGNSEENRGEEAPELSS